MTWKWRETLKMWEMRHKYCRTWNMAGNTEKRGKREMHTVGPGIWEDILRIVKNEQCTLYDLDSALKTEKREKGDTHMGEPGIWRENRKMCKMRHKHCMT